MPGALQLPLEAQTALGRYTGGSWNAVPPGKAAKEKGKEEKHRTQTDVSQVGGRQLEQLPLVLDPLWGTQPAPRASLGEQREGPRAQAVVWGQL